jgi:hypothetical protein
MIKLVLILIALAIGFGGGVYWAHKNPDAAAKLAAEEERRFLEAQLALNKKIQEKLASLDSKTSAKPGVSGFLSAGQSAAAAKQDVTELKSEADQQEQELRQRLTALPGGK